MYFTTRHLKKAVWFTTVIAALVLTTGKIAAHCDAVNGPVAIAAQNALEDGDFQQVAIWVGEEQENELRERFEQSRPVYREGGDAAQLAKRYFMETAVRLHREAEGMSYAGLKPAKPLPADIEAAEQALESGQLQPVTDLLTSELRSETEKWFQKVLDAKQRKDDSVEEGREYVDAYVKYVIYVHGLHQKIQAGPAHGVGE